MASVRVHKPNGCLFFDFRFGGQRRREYTLLPDTPANRKRLEKVLARIESEIQAGTFEYARYFPNSKAAQCAAAQPPAGGSEPAARPIASSALPPAAAPAPAAPATAVFRDFANQWVDERSIEWRRSHLKSLLSTLNGRLIPRFGVMAVSSITKSDILAFRAELAKVPGRAGRDGLSSKRINEIVGVLCQIMDEAADRFQFTPPTNGVRRLKVRKADVAPFSLDEVNRMLATVRADYRPYLTVRIFTGMRTGEVHGLKWKYVDFERRLILVRETFVLGEDDYTKTDGSQRDIQMSQPVYEALKLQFQASAKLSEYVFCNLVGAPLDNKNFSDRVWYPLLRYMGLERRRPYQMRHTAATLWLAAGEAPEWIARQLGHTSTEMLFRVYSRYVPNLTRQDGSAMDRLLASRFSTGQVLLRAPQGTHVYEPAALHSPAIPAQPVPKARGVPRRAGRTDGPGTARVSGDHRPQPPPAGWLMRASAGAHLLA